MSIDTVSDMLTRIRNANLARHNFVLIPWTKLTKEVAQILVDEGFIDSFKGINENFVKDRLLVLRLKYTNNEGGRKPRIESIQRISRPGRRIYKKVKEMPRILGGFGVAVVSTTKGLMTDHKARQAGIGGEMLFSIW